MNLKDNLLKLFEENNIKVERLRGRQRTLYKVNGNVLYITYKERTGKESESENYYLQVNKKLVIDSLSKYKNLTIFIICGSLSQILTVDAKEFLRITEKTRVYSDGNIKFNVFVTKRKADFQIRFPELGIVEFNKYVNAFERCPLTDRVASVLVKIQQEAESKMLMEKELEIPQIRIVRREKATFDGERVIGLMRSGEGDKLEQFILSLFEFWGFEIDKETSGQNGELDVICVSPICIGIECRSTNQSVGVNIIDELNRHIRRYENRSGLLDFIGVVICDIPTPQLVEDMKTEKRYLMNSETIINIMRFTFNYPLSPIEFSYFFKGYGDIRANVKSYLDEKLKKITAREAIISIFESEDEALGYADIKAHLKVRKFEMADEDIKEALVELSSPLVNWLENKNGRYRLIWKEKFWENQQVKLMEVLKWLH